MESFNPWALTAAAFALASGFAWARLAQQAVRRRKVAARATSDDAGSFPHRGIRRAWCRR